MASVKDHLPPETLPALYRRILDDVWALERAGSRAAAARLRAAATRSYSRAWDERAVRQLEEIGRSARRQLTTAGRPEPSTRLSRLGTRLRDARNRLPEPIVGASHRTLPDLG